MAAEPNPTLPPAPAPTPSQPPVRAPQKSTAALVAEAVVDVIAIVAVTVLAYKGKIEGVWALLMVGMLGGVRVTDLVSSIRPGGGGPGGPGAGGIAGLVVALVTGASHALQHLRSVGRVAMVMLALGAGASATSCSGSWETRAHRALVATAHAVAVADDTAAQAYQAEAHAADGGAAFAAIDSRYRRIQGAEEALSATLVRAEALLDDVHSAGPDAGTARCLALRALVQLAADARVFGGVLTAAGVTLSPDQAAVAHGIAAVIDEMAPRCEGADAGADVVTTDAGGDDA